MNDEISETAKAVQEVAKTTKAGIEATKKLGSFVARVTDESIEAITGMLSDKLRFKRWERQLRLRDRAMEIIEARGINEQFHIVPLKLALPIVENGSLEENDELQNLWANLLASALDPNFSGEIRTAYIDILKQLEVIDVHILKAIYDKYCHLCKSDDWSTCSPTRIPISSQQIIDELGLDESTSVYENSADNLIRVRCIATFMQVKEIRTGVRMPFPIQSYEEVSVNSRYQVCMTAFGVGFVKACLGS
ncbi:MAG TPA: Abi-alpha family protein [Pyrinomonadaceae bacterium]|jgi:hypothetical protein